LSVGVLARQADTAGINVGVVDRVFLLEAPQGAQDAHILGVGEAEPKTTLDDGSPL
jgi:hypothetical protein